MHIYIHIYCSHFARCLNNKACGRERKSTIVAHISRHPRRDTHTCPCSHPTYIYIYRSFSHKRLPSLRLRCVRGAPCVCACVLCKWLPSNGRAASQPTKNEHTHRARFVCFCVLLGSSEALSIYSNAHSHHARVDACLFAQPPPQPPPRIASQKPHAQAPTHSNPHNEPTPFEGTER